jgi:hypothetical protein
VPIHLRCAGGRFGQHRLSDLQYGLLIGDEFPEDTGPRGTPISFS